MKFATFLSVFGFALAAFMATATAADETEKTSAAAAQEARKSSYRSVRSPGGFVAHYLRFNLEDGDFEGRVFIEKDGRVLATISGVRAVSFSPTEDLLLVCEDIADDDNRHYLLDIGAGQYARTDKRADYAIGSRFVTRAEWSDDGKFVVLFDHPGITDQAPTVVSVAEKRG